MEPTDFRFRIAQLASWIVESFGYILSVVVLFIFGMQAILLLKTMDGDEA